MPAEDAAKDKKPPAEAKNILPEAPAEPAGSSGLTADEESQLGKLLEKRNTAAREGGVRMRVEPPHSELHYGSFVIGREYVTVPDHLVAGFSSAAADAGVELTQEQTKES